MFSKVIINCPWYYFLIAFTLSAGVTLWLYYKNKKNNDLSAQVLAGMAVLRFISLTLIFLLLLNILLKRIQNETENPVLLLALDNSTSIISSSDSDFVKNDFLAAFDSFKQQLEEKYEIKTLLFGSNAATSDKKASFTEKETDIQNLIDVVENNYSNQNIGALIIASDGIYNKGANPVYAAENAGYPIYTIALGDTNEIKDALIRKVNHNQVAYAGNIFPVEVVLNAKKYKGKDVTVSILENGNEKAKQTVKVNNDNFSGICNFTLEAASPGIVKYTAKINTLEGDKNTSNNFQNFVIEVIDSKEKVLLLASRPHPDIAAIKDAISNSTNYDLDYALTSDFSKNLKPYSLVILHGFEAAQHPFIETCYANQIPFWIINPASAENIPGIRITGTFNKFNEAEPGIEKNFGLFTLSDPLKKMTDNLPAVKVFFGNYNLNNGSVTLIRQRIGMVETENPVFYFSETNGLKSAVFLGDGLWKWKFRDFSEHKNHNLFHELISKTVQYLSVKNDKSFFRIKAPKITDENTEIELDAEVYNKSYEAITEPDVTLTLSNSENKKFNYTFSKNANAYHLNMGSLPAGEYQYIANVKVNNELFVKEGFFAVKEVISEKINTVADHQVLFQLASRSQGKMVYPNELKTLEGELLNNERIKPITYSQTSTGSLIELKWLFWMILILLSAEWFFRKRFLSI